MRNTDKSKSGYGKRVRPSKSGYENKLEPIKITYGRKRDLGRHVLWSK